jgi:hypothetical protein
VSFAQAALVNVPLTPDHQFRPALADPGGRGGSSQDPHHQLSAQPDGRTETRLYEEVVLARRHDLCVISDIAYAI